MFYPTEVNKPTTNINECFQYEWCEVAIHTNAPVPNPMPPFLQDTLPHPPSASRDGSADTVQVRNCPSPIW